MFLASGYNEEVFYFRYGDIILKGEVKGFFIPANSLLHVLMFYCSLDRNKKCGVRTRKCTDRHHTYNQKCLNSY
ncbi:hypothetical protein HMPREF0083_02883 [Aneurinibacillus aneurinilyticus ATCC 12856]|uniref:Uncharacterized protein n=1 Tax=Aneurinibacillus aneurinilyticus ATCC 12856 TaxID=649747 RepID=U1X2A8_ANEAE|nr:hypothetical protein HMPREF0083_02883 [Aneurinibacillus aneurinilyticus ATCC 12856]